MVKFNENNEKIEENNQKNEEHLDFLSTYCDLDTTFITIHPDPPYDKKSYHTEYSYSCNF